MRRVSAKFKSARSAATSHIVGVGGIIKGEGSDFVIQAPSPLTRKIKFGILKIRVSAGKICKFIQI